MKTSEIVRFAIRNHLWNGKSLIQWRKSSDLNVYACIAVDNAVRELKNKFPERFPDIQSVEKINEQRENIKEYINRMIGNRYTANCFVDAVMMEQGFIGPVQVNSKAQNIAMQAYRKSMLELIAVYFESKGD